MQILKTASLQDRQKIQVIMLDSRCDFMLYCAFVKDIPKKVDISLSPLIIIKEGGGRNRFIFF